MPVALPSAIAIYIAAANGGETRQLSEGFANNAVVKDEGQVVEGLTSIRRWIAETRAKYQHKIEPLAFVQKDAKTIVTNRLSGNFPGSPIELDFVFTLEDDKIISLEILS